MAMNDEGFLHGDDREIITAPSAEPVNEEQPLILVNQIPTLECNNTRCPMHQDPEFRRLFFTDCVPADNYLARQGVTHFHPDDMKYIGNGVPHKRCNNLAAFGEFQNEVDALKASKDSERSNP